MQGKETQGNTRKHEETRGYVSLDVRAARVDRAARAARAVRAVRAARAVRVAPGAFLSENVQKP